jgi:hypothetical protein
VDVEPTHTIARKRKHGLLQIVQYSLDPLLFGTTFKTCVVKKTMFLLLLESAPPLPSCLSPANIGKTSPYHTKRRKALIEEREVASIAVLADGEE